MKRITKILLALVLALSLSVSPAVELFSSSAHVEAAKTFKICKGEKLQLTVTANKKIKSKKWKSSNKKIASISKKGVVTGKKSGTVKITCTMKVKVGKKTKTYTKTCKIKVLKKTVAQVAAEYAQQVAARLPGMCSGAKITNSDLMAKADVYAANALQYGDGYLLNIYNNGEIRGYLRGYCSSVDDFLSGFNSSANFQTFRNDTATSYFGISCTYVNGTYYYLLIVL